MDILILGGTGAMGKSLVEILANSGHNLYVTSRSSHKSDWNNVHYIQGNAHDESFLAHLLTRNYDAIVDFMHYPPMVFRNRIMMFLSSSKQYVFLSSSRVYADSKTAIREISPRLLDVCQDQEYISTNEYALAKAQEEDMLYNSGQSNWTIIRPYITYNDNRLQLTVLEKERWLYRALQGRTIVVPQKLLCKMTTITYGYDVALAISKMIGNSRAMGETVHIVQPEAIRWADVLDLYLDVIERKTGVRPKVWTDIEPNIMGRANGNIYQVKYDRQFDRVFDNSKTDAILGYNVKYTSVCDGLKKCMEQFIDNGTHFDDINWRYEAFMDIITGEHAKLSEIKGLKNKIKYILYRYTSFLDIETS